MEKIEQINELIQEYKKTTKESADNVSDGYHTFAELYYQRMVLFKFLCKVFKDKSWRSKLHGDSTMFKDYFIVGITTPKGDYTYHYHMKDWEHFKEVKELNNAPEYDGHTEKDILERLNSLF